MAHCSAAVNPLLAMLSFKLLCPLTLTVARPHSHSRANIPSYLRGPIKGRIENSWVSWCDLSAPTTPPGPFRRSGCGFCLRGGLNNAEWVHFSEKGLLLWRVGGWPVRAGAGPTSVCVQSQAGPEHRAPRRPPSPLHGGLCSRFHAITAAACFPAQSCQGHKGP